MSNSSSLQSVAVSPSQAPSFSGGYKAWLLLLLVLVSASSFMDRIIMATVGQAVKEELQLSDFQLGLLGGLAFAVFYTGVGIPIARLAERFSRVRIIAICVIAWSAMTALCGMAQNFWQLLLCRMGVGIGEGGCTPASHSLISDHFAREKRASALALFALGVPIGAGLGAVVGGWIVENIGWREAFYILGLPGVLLGLVVVATLREPPRGLSEPQAASDDEVPPFSTVIRRLREKVTFGRLCIGVAVGAFATYGISMFIPIFLIRNYGVDYAQAGMLFGLMSGIGAFIGNAAGGFVADWGGRRDARWYGWVPGFGFALSAPLYAAGFLVPSLTLAVVLIFIGNIFAMMNYAPTFAVAQNLVEPRMRASASAILLFMMNIIGMGVGPLFLGFISDVYAASAFSLGDYAQLCPGGVAAPDSAAGIGAACAQASTLGLKWAAVTCSLAFVAASLTYFAVARSVRHDMKA
ncbi:MAG: MFS transporter [Spongiibacteraceae bacterium]|jgi:MFS family permease|nr:MFS transporter [Spongiibacteraceae bacterium]